MGKQKSQKDNERFRSWTQHIYQRFSSVLDEPPDGELTEFASRTFAEIEKESLVVNSSESRAVRHGISLNRSRRGSGEKSGRRPS